MELNLECLDTSEGSSFFSIGSDKQYILNHSLRSEFSFHPHSSGQRLDDILNNWLHVVYDAKWQWNSL